MIRRNWIGMSLLIVACLGGQQGCEMKGEGDPISAQKDETQTNKDAAFITLNPDSQRLAEIILEETAFRSIRSELQVPGTIQANENRLAHVGSRIPGRIVDVTAGLGDRVKKGEKLALIDSPELGRAQSDFLTATAKLLVAEKAYERAKALAEGKVIGTGEFQRRAGEYFSSKTEAQAAENRLHLLGMTEEAVAGLGDEDFIRSQVAITSPLSGTVIERHVTVGEVVEPVNALFTVADLTKLWGIADLPEKDLSRVRKGLIAEVSVSAYSQDRFRGKVTYLADTIDPSSRTVKVRIEVDNAEGRLKPEMFASFRILTEETEKILTIPGSAVQRDGAQANVFVAHEGKGFEKRAVELGPEVGGYYQVLSGLKTGEKVVSKGAFVLKSETQKGLMEE